MYNLMKYSSHLYLRTDGTLGRYPLIEIDKEGIIVSVSESNGIAQEIAHTRFFTGIIVPSFALPDDNMKLSFQNKADFLNQINNNIATRAQQLNQTIEQCSIAVGNKIELYLISGFDLNTFNGAERVNVQNLICS